MLIVALARQAAAIDGIILMAEVTIPDFRTVEKDVAASKVYSEAEPGARLKTPRQVTQALIAEYVDWEIQEKLRSVQQQNAAADMLDGLIAAIKDRIRKIETTYGIGPYA